MEYRIFRLIKHHGNYNSEADFELIYSALQEVIQYDLEEVPNEKIVDAVTSLVKCDNCEQFEHEMFTYSTTRVRAEDGGDWGTVCFTCQGNG